MHFLPACNTRHKPLPYYRSRSKLALKTRVTATEGVYGLSGTGRSKAFVVAGLIIGGLLMSGRRLTSDSGEPDLWSNGSVFMGPREPISIDPSPHIPLQQTTARRRVRLNEGQEQ